MAHRRMWIWATRRRFGGVLAALAVHMILILGLVVVRVEILIGDRPCWRNPTVMTNLAEVLSTQPEERSSIKFRIAAYIVVDVRMEVLAVPVLPHFLRLILAVKVNGGGAPVVFLARDVIAPFEQQNSLTGGREL